MRYVTALCAVPPNCILMPMNELRAAIATMPKLVQDKMNRLYKSAVYSWMAVTDRDDYFKFLLTQVSLLSYTNENSVF